MQLPGSLFLSMVHNVSKRSMLTFCCHSVEEVEDGTFVQRLFVRTDL